MIDVSSSSLLHSVFSMFPSLCGYNKPVVTVNSVGPNSLSKVNYYVHWSVTQSDTTSGLSSSPFLQMTDQLFRLWTCLLRLSYILRDVILRDITKSFLSLAGYWVPCYLSSSAPLKEALLHLELLMCIFPVQVLSLGVLYVALLTFRSYKSLDGRHFLLNSIRSVLLLNPYSHYPLLWLLYPISVKNFSKLTVCSVDEKFGVRCLFGTCTNFGDTITILV